MHVDVKNNLVKVMEGKKRETERGEIRYSAFFKKISNSFVKSIPKKVIFIAFKWNKVFF